MWSVGVICYVLLSGLSPFMGDSDSDTFSNILRADYDFNDEAFDEVSQEAKDFIASLLLRNKEDRFTATECLQSKWLCRNGSGGAKILSTDKLKKFIVRRKWQVSPICAEKTASLNIVCPIFFFCMIFFLCVSKNRKQVMLFVLLVVW